LIDRTERKKEKGRKKDWVMIAREREKKKRKRRKKEFEFTVRIG